MNEIEKVAAGLAQQISALTAGRDAQLNAYVLNASGDYSAVSSNHDTKMSQHESAKTADESAYQALLSNTENNMTTRVNFLQANTLPEERESWQEVKDFVTDTNNLINTEILGFESDQAANLSALTADIGTYQQMIDIWDAHFNNTEYRA